jgi:hypothetical protein
MRSAAVLLISISCISLLILILILLILWAHIVVVVSLPVAQSVGVFAHWWLHLLLSVKVLLGERCLSYSLDEAVANYGRVKAWVHIVKLRSLRCTSVVRSHSSWVIWKELILVVSPNCVVALCLRLASLERISCVSLHMGLSISLVQILFAHVGWR